jgi:tryptophan halogenase
MQFGGTSSRYLPSYRQDSLFWLENRDLNTMSEELINKLAMWGKFISISDDFFSQFEVLYLDNFLFVLYGMKYQTILSNRELTDSAERIVAVQEITDNLMNNLPDYRELLEKIKKFGLQKF